MFFDISLYFAFLIFLIGLIYRVSLWFKIDFLSDGGRLSSATKAGVVLATIFKTVFSTRIFLFLYSFIVDGLLQVRVLKAGFLRWFMHFSIFAGFMLLIVMHVFDETITQKFFIDYASTLNPFMFLRNLLGLLVLIGLAIAIYRRLFLGGLKTRSNNADYIAIALTAVIIVSGFLLESVKIVSEPVYDRMIEEYSDIEEEDESAALKVYWEKEFHVVFSVMPEAVDDEMFEAGIELHEDTCASCHTKPAAAFVSFPVMKVIKPFALYFNDIRADLILFYIHYLSAFLALALLPFTKAFHLISTPLSMSLNRISKGDTESNEAKSVKRMIELDACVHCGSCTSVCSVGPIFNVIGNDTILPSEKISAVGEFVKGKTNFKTNNGLLEGSVICTDCYRCNDICPAGIDLRDIWNTSKAALERSGYVQPHDLVKQKTMHEWHEVFEKDKPVETYNEIPKTSIVKIIDNPEFFSNCIQCTTCANVCPVVENSDGSSHDAGMSPQQVMNFLRLEMKDMALVSGLVWNCVTCYMCQEHCPREIPVADIIAEFRNQGFVKLNDLAISGEIQE